MGIAYLSTLSALAGSVVGGLTSGVATWLSQRAQARESQLAREMARRDDLYKEFIAAASKAYGEAIVSNEPNVQEFVALYAMISRMRLQSPPQTVACAEKVMRQQSTPALHLARRFANCMNPAVRRSIPPGWRLAQALRTPSERGMSRGPATALGRHPRSRVATRRRPPPAGRSHR